MADKQSTLRELALFAGAGGGILGGHLLGWRTVCAVEANAYAASVLVARQNDGCLEAFPVWDNVRTFDGREWQGLVDVVSGGFPCQDISAAGKGVGIEGARSGLWREMARIVGEVRPRFVFVENSPMLVSRGLSTVLGDLAAMGFDAKWGVVSAEEAIFLGGDPAVYHERERIWIVAESTDAKLHRVSKRRRTKTAIENGGTGRSERNGGTGVPIEKREVDQNIHATGERFGEAGEHRPDESTERISGICEDADAEIAGPQSGRRGQEIKRTCEGSWWGVEPGMGRVVARLPSRVDRLKALGNAQVPCVAKLAWEILTGEFS
jgi:DNA (cytosine-5)-methyltransferase 1